MNQKSRGIVLHCIKYSETSVIAKIYTDNFGLLSFIVKGVRSAKSKAKASLLQPLTILDLEFQYRENKPLLFIKEFKRHYTYLSLPFNTIKSSVALFMLEVLNKTVREHEANDEMFDFIYDTLHNMDSCEKLNPDFHLLFLIQLSRYLGFAPHENYSTQNCFFEMQEGYFTNNSFGPTTLDKSDSEMLNKLIACNVFSATPTLSSRLDRNNLLQHLLKYYQFHIEHFNLKSPEILQEILS